MSFQIQNTGTACFQREPLTLRLRNLIHDYPEGVGIVKELIQNADDAGAKRIHITFDWRQHACHGLLPAPTMRELMGAAMVVIDIENHILIGLLTCCPNIEPIAIHL